MGSKTRAKIVKNKVAPPFRQAEFDIMFGEGISREGSLLDVAVDLGIVRKSGAWFTFESEQLGQGRENAKRFLRENPEIAMQLQAKIYDEAGLTPSDEEDEGNGDVQPDEDVELREDIQTEGDSISEDAISESVEG